MSSLALFGIFAGLKPVRYAPLRLSIGADMPAPIHVGDRIGHLVVRRLSDRTDARGNRFFWECLCDCTGTIEVHANHLRAGTTRSCGDKCRIKKAWMTRSQRRAAKARTP